MHMCRLLPSLCNEDGSYHCAGMQAVTSHRCYSELACPHSDTHTLAHTLLGSNGMPCHNTKKLQMSIDEETTSLQLLAHTTLTLS